MELISRASQFINGVFFHPARGQKSRLSNGLARVPSYTRLIGVRVCLGVAEAGLFPGVVH